MGQIIQEMYKESCETYAKVRKKSEVFMKKADAILPGGESRSCIIYDPFNICVDWGKGYTLHDIDGFKYIDYLNNYMSLIHGHADEDVVKAIQNQAEKGTAFAAPGEEQYNLADMIVKRSKYIDNIQFCNSGTEAMLGCVRLARTYTKKDIIIRIEGMFNGSADVHAVSEWPDIDRKEGTLPKPILETGVTKAETLTTIPVPFNDLEIMEMALKKYENQVAGIVIEGIGSATLMKMPERTYLLGLRELANKYDALLIIDEVITFRMSQGGFHTLMDIEPDLIGLGKLIGGGLPVGAFAGKKDIMRYLDPKIGKAHLGLSGTFSGNPLTMAAGAATLKKYDQQAIDKVNGLGERLKQGLEKGAREVGLPLNITGYGSLLALHYSNRELNDCTDAYKLMQETVAFRKLIHMEALNAGYYMQQKQRFVISTPMDENLVDQTIKDYTEIFRKCKPAHDELNIE